MFALVDRGGGHARTAGRSRRDAGRLERGGRKRRVL